MDKLNIIGLTRHLFHTEIKELLIRYQYFGNKMLFTGVLCRVLSAASFTVTSLLNFAS